MDGDVHSSEQQISREKEEEDPRIKKGGIEWKKKKGKKRKDQKQTSTKDKKTATPEDSKKERIQDKHPNLQFENPNTKKAAPIFARFDAEISHFDRKSKELTTRTYKNA